MISVIPLAGYSCDALATYVLYTIGAARIDELDHGIAKTLVVGGSALSRTVRTGHNWLKCSPRNHVFTRHLSDRVLCECRCSLVYSLGKVHSEGRIGQRITVLDNEVSEVICDLLCVALDHTRRVSALMKYCAFHRIAVPQAVQRTVRSAKYERC